MSGKQPAHAVFFPLAAAYAMLALPASLIAMRGGAGWLPGLATPAGHGHEMLFGFAFAVVAGFLVTRIELTHLAALAGLWLLARAAHLVQPMGLTASAANIAFAATVAWLAAPKFLRAAKKLRNRLFGPVLIALAATVVAWHATVLLPASAWQGTLLREAMVLFALLMFFMGGRIVAPAAAGHFQRLGEELEARVQPRLEGVVLVLLLAALVVLPFPPAAGLAAAALAGAGLVTGVRLARWRLWRCRGRPDLIGLGIGYAWLAAGLVLMGAALLVGAWRFSDAMHAITIGALGTLTISVIARTRLLRAKRDPARPPGVPLAVGLVGCAALARVTAPAWPVDPWSVYWGAALAWGLAYLLLLRLFLLVPARPELRNGPSA